MVRMRKQGRQGRPVSFDRQVHVIDATPVMEYPEGSLLGVHVRDKKGRPMWNMPKPVEHIKHKRKMVDRKTGQELPPIPVYQAIDVSLATYIKSQVMRKQRSQRIYSGI